MERIKESNWGNQEEFVRLMAEESENSKVRNSLDQEEDISEIDHNLEIDESEFELDMDGDETGSYINYKLEGFDKDKERKNKTNKEQKDAEVDLERKIRELSREKKPRNDNELKKVESSMEKRIKSIENRVSTIERTLSVIIDLVKQTSKSELKYTGEKITKHSYKAKGERD